MVGKPKKSSEKRHAIEFGEGINFEKPRKYFRGYQIDDISAGGTHFLALSENRVLTWGKGKDGQLGLGESITISLKPKQIIFDKDIIIRSVHCGPLQSGAITDTGELYLWGVLSSGPTFEPILQSLPSNRIVLDVDFGPTCIVVLLQKKLETPLAKNTSITWSDKNETEVWVWGSALKHQLGIGYVNSIDIPTRLSQLNEKKICKISAGETHMAALTGCGEVYLWGDNEDNILGFPENIDTSTPKKLSIPGHFLIDIICGFRHTFAITSDYRILAWGYARHGVLGTGDEQTISIPTFINIFKHGDVIIDKIPKVIKISSGGMHTLILTDKGYVYSWGEGRSYKTCFKSDKDILYPTLIHTKFPVSIGISCSSSSSVILQGFPKITLYNKEKKIGIPITNSMRNIDMYNKAKDSWDFTDQSIIIVTSIGEELPITGNFHSFLRILTKPRLYILSYPSSRWKNTIGKEDDTLTLSYLNDTSPPLLISGSLQRIIFYLLFPYPHDICDTTKIFFKTYKRCSLITPTQLLQRLFLEYHNTESIDCLMLRKSGGTKIINLVKYRILKLFLRWIKYDPKTFQISNTGFNASFIHFIEFSVIPLFPNIAQIILQELWICETIIEYSYNVPEFPFYKNIKETNTITKSSIIDSYLRIARQLSLIDHYLFQQINEKELLNYSYSCSEDTVFKKIPQDNWPAISYILDRIVTIRDWVITQILSTCTQFRLSIFEYFTDLARSLYNDCNNYQSFYSIYLGLSSNLVFQVFIDTDCYKEIEETIEKLSLLVLKREDKATENRIKKNAHVPCLVSILEMIYEISEPLNTMPTFTDIITFASMEEFYAITHSVKAAQEIQYTYSKDDIKIAYLLDIRGLSPRVLNEITFVLTNIPKKELLKNKTKSNIILSNAKPASSIYDTPFIFYLNKVSSELSSVSQQHRYSQIQLWTRQLKDQTPFHDVLVHPLLFLLGDKSSDKYLTFSCTFKELFLRSKAVENVLGCILREYPETQDENIIEEFLRECFLPSVDCKPLLIVLKGLSNCSLDSNKQRKLLEILASFRDYRFPDHEKGYNFVKKEISVYSSKFSMARSALANASSNDIKNYISRALSVIKIGGILMDSYLSSQCILREQHKYLNIILKELESSEFQNLSEHLLKRKIELQNPPKPEYVIADDYIPNNIKKDGIKNSKELTELEKQKEKLLTRLHQVRGEIIYSKETIEDLTRKIALTDSQYKRNITNIDNEIEKENKNLTCNTPSVPLFKEFWNNEQNIIMDEMKRDSSNIKEHLLKLEPSLKQHIIDYINIQITFLECLRDLFNNKNEITEEYIEWIINSEASSHSLGEILSILEQQDLDLDFNEIAKKITYKNLLQKELQLKIPAPDESE